MICMTKVASREYLLWLVLWDVNHTLHKFFLGVAKVMVLLCYGYKYDYGLSFTLTVHVGLQT